jgi:hypothetical protein
MYGHDEKCHHHDHYDTKKEAKEAARRMGLSGCHKMQCDGKTVYMPGDSHAEYMDYNDGMGGNPPVDSSVFGL